MKSLRLAFLLCALTLQHFAPTALTATTPQVLGSAEVTGTCPANCQLVQSVNVSPAEDGNGIRVGVDWTTAALPTGVNLVSFTLSVKLVLKDNKTVDSGERRANPNERSALFVLQGPGTNRNINLADVKSGTAVVKASAMTASNPTVNVTSKEITGDDGAQVNMRVRWTPPPANSPCLAERTVLVAASAENAGGIKFDGSEMVRLSAGSAIVRLRGVGLRRKDMKNLQANLNVGPVFLSCSQAKSFQSFGGATGSNP